MNKKYLLCSLLLLLGGGWTVYREYQRQTINDLLLSAESTPQLDYLIAPESFSRIENTKATLEGLCLRLRLKTQSNLVKANYSNSTAAEEHNRLERAIQDLQRAMVEFKGTDQELELVQELFPALERADHLDRWLELWLRTLYEHPTHAVPLRYAKEALDVGRALGREHEVFDALKHLSTIPLKFARKNDSTTLSIYERAVDLLTNNTSIAALEISADRTPSAN